MKKIAYTLTAGLVLGLSSCGVSIPTSPAQKLAYGDNPDFATARSLAAKDRDSQEYTDKAHAWFASGDVEHALFNSEMTKMMLPTMKADTAKMYEALLNEVPFFERAYELDKESKNEKGEANPRFEAKIKEKLASHHRYFINAGYFYLQKENYDQAFKAFDKYLSIRQMPIFANDPAMQAEDSATMDARYLAVASAYQGKKYKEAIDLASKFKDMKYEQNNIYQILAASYAAQGDTTKYMEVLKEGADKFQDAYYLGNIVNVYSLQNKIDDAIAYLQKAIDKNPSNTNFLNAMGSLFERKEDYKSAADQYKKILDIKADDFDGNYNYARSLYNQAVMILNAEKVDKLERNKAMDLYKAALPYFETAYKVNPKQVYYILGSVYNALGMEAKYNEVMDANKE